MVNKKRKQKPVYVKITFLLMEKDIVQRKSPNDRYKSHEEGLRQLLRSIGITNYKYEFGTFERKPSHIEFESDSSLRGKYFSSAFLPKPVKLKIKRMTSK